MAVFWRFVSEFWIAFLVALGWAILRNWPLTTEWTWAGAFVANLGGAFFLASWFTGQFVRIKRQQMNEQTSATFMDQLGRLTSAVSELTTKVTDVVAREPALPKTLAQDLLSLVSNANTQLAAANSTAAMVLSTLPWQADTPLPLRVPRSPAALEPASTWVPKPPDKPSATGPT
jgi:hypothetical protein